MRERYVKLITLLFSVLLFATGCWDSMDIEDKNIATTVIFDKKDGEYSFYVEIAAIDTNQKNNVDASCSSGSYEANGFTFVRSHGKTIVENRRNLDMQMDKPLYLPGVRALMITERAAQADLAEYLFRLKADLEYRQKLNVFISREEPEDLIRSKTENALSFGFAVDDMLDQLMDNGQAFTRTTSRYVDNILSHSGFCIPCIDLQSQGMTSGDAGCADSSGMESRNMIFSGYSVIDYNARCIGFIPVEQAKGLVFMKEDNPKEAYLVPLEDDHATVRVELTQKEMTPSFHDGKIDFSLQYGFNAQVLYFKQINAMPMDGMVQEEIREKLEEMLKKDLEDTISLSQNGFRCDYLAFDDVFRMDYPAEFKKMNWAEQYPKANMLVQVEVNLETEPRLDYEPSGQ